MRNSLLTSIVILLWSCVAAAQGKSSGEIKSGRGQVFMGGDAIVTAQWTVTVQCIYGPWQFDFGDGSSMTAPAEGSICVGGTSPIHFGWLGRRLYVYAEDGRVFMNFGFANEINEFKFGVKGAR